MNVQPYFPEPIEVPGNIANASYRTLNKFIKTVGLLYYSTLVFAWFAGQHFAQTWSLRFAATFLVGSIIFLSLSRTWLKGVTEVFVSTVVLIPTLVGVGTFMALLEQRGFPSWVLAICVSAATLYNVLSGLDFSFSGQFFLSLLTVWVYILTVYFFGKVSSKQAIVGSLFAVSFLFYFVYDFACLLKRRIEGEQVAAVSDLYRDVFNIFSYTVRVIYHWRKFKI